MLWAPHLNPLRADMSSAIMVGSLGTPEEEKTGWTLSRNPIKTEFQNFAENFLEVGTPNRFEK